MQKIFIILVPLLMLLLPLHRVFPSFNLFGVTIDILIIVLFLLVIISTFKNIFNMSNVRLTIVDYSIILLIFVFIRIIFESKILMDASYLAVHSLYIPILIYYVIKSTVVNHKIYIVCLKSYMIGTIILSLASIIIFLGTYSRSYPLGIHAISAATLLFMGFSISFTSQNSIRIKQYLNRILIFVGITALLARAYLVFSIFYLVFFKAAKKGYIFYVVIFFFCSTLIMTLLLAKAPYYIDIEGKRVKKEAASYQRLVDSKYWKYDLHARALSYNEALKNFSQNKIFGVGLYRGDIVITRHNFHIEWLEYGGIFGYIVYLNIFILFYWSIRKVSRIDKHVAAYGVGVLGILMNCLTNGILHGFMPHAIFTLMGLCSVRIKLLNKS